MCAFIYCFTVSVIKFILISLVLILLWLQILFSEIDGLSEKSSSVRHLSTWYCLAIKLVAFEKNLTILLNHGLCKCFTVVLRF